MRYGIRTWKVVVEGEDCSGVEEEVEGGCGKGGRESSGVEEEVYWEGDFEGLYGGWSVGGG